MYSRGDTAGSQPHHKNGLSAFCVHGADEYKGEEEVWPHCSLPPAHTHDVEGGLCVLDVAAVARNAGIAPRVLRGHFMDRPGAVLEDVHPARREATGCPPRQLPADQAAEEVGLLGEEDGPT